jgi:NAD(P)-dependent dehydrogenase (short-subunit alcohol dehydrogenase family)
VDLGLTGRSVVVTGAGRGIGRQVARAVLAEGGFVVACARTEADLRSLAAEATDASSVLVVPVDLTAEGAEGHIVAVALERFGRLDVLVNNAGGPSPTRLDRMTDRRWREGFEVDFFAAARLATAAVEPMRAAGWGRIVNVASTYGREPDPGYAAYGAAKAALINLTKSFARAYGAEGVNTNCVIPGVTLTEGVEVAVASVAERRATSMAEVLDATMARDPVAVGRFGTPDEIAAAIAFLVSEQASWINGSCLAVDGSTLRVAP